VGPVTLHVVGASRGANTGNLTITASGVEFAPGFLEYGRRKQWPAGSIKKISVRKGVPAPASLGLGLVLMSLILVAMVGPIALLMWPVAGLFYVWNGLFGTHLVIESDGEEAVYFVKGMSVPEVQAILDAACIGEG
jgi:hypothetical protein